MKSSPGNFTDHLLAQQVLYTSVHGLYHSTSLLSGLALEDFALHPGPCRAVLYSNFVYTVVSKRCQMIIPYVSERNTEGQRDWIRQPSCSEVEVGVHMPERIRPGARE